MTKSINLKLILAGLAALIVAGFVGYSLRGSSLVNSNLKSGAVVTTTNTNGTTTTSTSSTNTSNSNTSSNYKYSYLKTDCTNALKDYGTSIRAKAETMATNIRAQVKNSGNNANASQYQPQIDQLLAYVKTMQTNMATLQTCITQADQGHNFSSTELTNINAAIAAAKQ